MVGVDSVGVVGSLGGGEDSVNGRRGFGFKTMVSESSSWSMGWLIVTAKAELVSSDALHAISDESFAWDGRYGFRLARRHKTGRKQNYNRVRWSRRRKGVLGVS